MQNEMESPLVGIFNILQTCSVGIADILQRIVILLTDLMLILFALVAINKDWNNSCDEPLLMYGSMCVMLCTLDLVWEVARCSMESQLDRLQSDFRPDAVTPSGQGNEGLLGDGPQEGLGQHLSDLRPTDCHQEGGRIGSMAEGAIGAGIRKEKAIKQKRTAELHFWSIVFSCFVSVVFAFFSAHDEDCAVHVPHLYAYIHAFNYTFIFRLGAIMVWICCRTVKNYEDAANAAGALAPRSPGPARELRSF